MKVMIINGPNMNMLGHREPAIYGSMQYQDLIHELQKHAKKYDISLHCVQSNSEGKLVDYIQECFYKKYDGLIINPAAYSHTSIAILDALTILTCLKIEVHISDIQQREAFRNQSLTSMAVDHMIMGHGVNGYFEALDFLHLKLQKK